MSDEKWKKKKLLEQSKQFQSAVIKPLQSETLSRLDKKRKPRKSNFVANRQIFVNPDHSDSGSEHASELDEGSEHAFRATCTSSHKRIPMSSSSSSTTDASSSSTTLSSNDTLDSSIHKFREDFEEFKCKMKIFGESLNLCKCIANDFQGRLSNMEYKLFGLEKRQKTDRKRSNYHQIIQKNKEMETKTKQFVQKLQKCGTEDEMREVAGRICKNYLHGLWKVAQPEELKFRRVTGGLSNFIYSIGLPDNVRPLYERIKRMDEDESREIKSAIEVGDVPKQVLLRIYGQVHGERAMDAIVTESVIFTLLSERRLGPKLYGVFSGGRIEEFIPARPLLIKELREPAISMKIAEKTAAIHSMEIPLSKEPNYIWKTMYKWLKTVKEECFTTGIKGKNNVEITAIKRLKEVNYDHEIEWLKKYLISFESPVVFCHNDLQEGNILYLEEEAHMTGDDFDSNPYLSVDDIQSLPRLDSDEESRLMVPSHPCSTCEESQDTWVHKEDEDENNIHKADSWFDGQRTAALSQPSYIAHNALPEEDTVLSEPSGEPKLYLIDFEYCAYNYRAFDIANHFQEWAYDYTTSYHPFYTERQEDWPTLEQKEIFIREYLKHYNANTSEDKQPVAPDIDQVNKLLAEVDAFALGSHLFWTLWSIVNASKSQIPFGYWEYGLARLDTYQRLKQEVIKKEQYGLPQKRKIEEVDI